MLQLITIENFQQMMGCYSTAELEGMVDKFPYFQQAHLLLAKKYQQENSPKFDQQLQLAALYINDRELLFHIFHEKKRIAAVHDNPSEPAIEPVKLIEEKIQVDETEKEKLNLIQEKITEPVNEEKQTEEEITPEHTLAQKKEDQISRRYELHTFDDWLKAFNKPKDIETGEIPVEQSQVEEGTGEDLDNLIKQNIPVDYLHKLVEDETRYSKGLDEFIVEQIEKHKQSGLKNTAMDSKLSPDLITETMAKVYEMQKKYNKAINAYEILTLKFPEKSSFFAARINYLKNII